MDFDLFSEDFSGEFESEMEFEEVTLVSIPMKRKKYF